MPQNRRQKNGTRTAAAVVLRPPRADNRYEVSGSLPYQALLDVLHEFGVRTLEDRTRDGEFGFPVRVDLPAGGAIYLDLPEPGVLSALDPDAIGIALVDQLGYPGRPGASPSGCCPSLRPSTAFPWTSAP